jgi:predicted component of type VI protein secretion system
VAPAPVEQAAIAPASPPASGDAAGFAAFAAGAGIAGTPTGEPSATLAALGAAFRATVSGLRRLLIARATIKGEFRMEQTMIRASGNNPLKFSADDNDALAALLCIGRQGGMTPAQATCVATSSRWRRPCSRRCATSWASSTPRA